MLTIQTLQSPTVILKKHPKEKDSLLKTDKYKSKFLLEFTKIITSLLNLSLYCFRSIVWKFLKVKTF